MKYTIYKLNGKFGTHRWWKNYDANNKNLPDIDIETYISGKNLSWTPLLNTKGQPIKYETTNKVNIDEIEIYIDDINNVPDYLKIEFTKGDSTKESAYYYPYYQPTIYNATNKLAVKVRYVLDAYASYMFKFHTYLKSINPNMFFVRKHTNRVKKDTTTNKWYFDFNELPYLARTNDNVNGNLITKQKLQYSIKDLRQQILNGYVHSLTEYEFRFADDDDDVLQYRETGDTEWREQFNPHHIYTSGEFQEGSGGEISFIRDSFGETFEFLVIKPNGYVGIMDRDKTQDVYNDCLLLVPVKKQEGLGNENDERDYEHSFAYRNEYPYLTKNFAEFFNQDNLLGKIILPFSYICLAGMFGNFSNREPVSNLIFNSVARIYKGKNVEADNWFDAFLIPPVHTKWKLPPNNFLLDLQNILANFNEQQNYLKTKENNPHLFAPSYRQFKYLSTTNNQSILTADYLDLLDYENIDLYFDYYISNDCVARILTESWNKWKQLSQGSNELTAVDTRQLPIGTNGWLNAFQQRNLLDNSRNNLVKSSIGSLAGGGAGLIASVIALSLSAVFTGGATAPLVAGGVAGLIGSGTTLAGSGVRLANGLAQYETQKKNLQQAPETFNAPEYASGRLLEHTWGEKGLLLYYVGLDEQETNIVNNDDNMYGYYVESWLPYNDYLNCWDGNYMLCDVHKNANNLFILLKSLNSIYTINDDYINTFLNAINNGITWFANGEYKDLATDIYNYERVFPQPNKK